MKEKLCAECATPFIPRHHRIVTCGETCWEKRRQDTIDRAIFNYQKGDGRKTYTQTRRDYCANNRDKLRARGNAYYQNNKEKVLADRAHHNMQSRQPRKPRLLACKICSGKYIHKGKSSFCSDKCRKKNYALYAQKTRQKNIAPIEKECAQCRTPYTTIDRRSKLCGIECREKRRNEKSMKAMSLFRENREIAERCAERNVLIVIEKCAHLSDLLHTYKIPAELDLAIYSKEEIEAMQFMQDVSNYAFNPIQDKNVVYLPIDETASRQVFLDKINEVLAA